MQEFQIRILDKNDVPYLSFTRELMSTHTAVTSAAKVARGRPFEIWCEGRCVYTSAPSVQAPPPGAVA